MELLLVAVIGLARLLLTVIPLLEDSEKPSAELFHLTIAAQHPGK